MDKITVVCHKDHDKGYEDYAGKCLLCEIERLQKREWVGLTAVCKEKEWVGLTDEERFLNDCRSPEEIEYAIAIEAKLKEKNHG